MGPRGIMVSDEEYARQLQDEYDREAMRMSYSVPQQQQQERPSPQFSILEEEEGTQQQYSSSYPSAPSRDYEYDDDIWSLRAIPATNPSADENDNDEELARKLQQQQTIFDEAEQRHLQQLQQDEQLARQLQLMEDQRAAAAAAVQPTHTSNSQPTTTPPPPKSCFQKARKILCWSFLVAVIAVAAILMFSFFSGKNIIIPINGGSGNGIPNIFDPYKGTGGTFPTSKWETSSSESGVQLTVYNALSSDWYPYFTQALQNWAFGHTPTSLLLYTQQAATDSSCSSISNAIKVCNGDYGDTGWKGINEAMVTSNGWITESTARMNDYYLSTASDGEKLYTMCHETGHAWGLNHQDENFYNKDLGSCMDYVSDPQNNQKPNDKDFEILYELYGYIPNGTATTTNSSSGRQRRQQQIMESSVSPRPNFISFTERNHPDRQQYPWRLLQRTKEKEIHTLDLDNGYRMITHVMLA